MCRYAMGNYKRRYACFACRKSYKRRNAGDIGHHGEDRPARCPQCGLLMANMGRDFQPPRQADDRAWTTAEALFSVGVTFHSCGCSGPGYRPRDPRELQAFFAGVHAEYLATLQQWRANERVGAEERTRAVELWQGRVAAVAAAMTAAGPM